MMTTSFWAYSWISVSQALKVEETHTPGASEGRWETRPPKTHKQLPPPPPPGRGAPPPPHPARNPHSPPPPLFFFFFAEKAGNDVAENMITFCHFQQGLWEIVGVGRAHISRRKEEFSLRERRKWKRARLTLMLSNDALLVMS